MRPREPARFLKLRISGDSPRAAERPRRDVKFWKTFCEKLEKLIPWFFGWETIRWQLGAGLTRKVSASCQKSHLCGRGRVYQPLLPPRGAFAAAQVIVRASTICRPQDAAGIDATARMLGAARMFAAITAVAATLMCAVARADDESEWRTRYGLAIRTRQTQPHRENPGCGGSPAPERASHCDLAEVEDGAARDVTLTTPQGETGSSTDPVLIGEDDATVSAHSRERITYEEIKVSRTGSVCDRCRVGESQGVCKLPWCMIADT